MVETKIVLICPVYLMLLFQITHRTLGPTILLKPELYQKELKAVELVFDYSAPS